MTDSNTTDLGATLDGAPEAAAKPGVGDRIDWDLAAATGRRIVRPGPRVTDYTLDQARAELADAALRAEAPVREVTGLADGLPVPAARILDRPQWIDSAARSMQAMLSATADVADPSRFPSSPGERANPAFSRFPSSPGEPASPGVSRDRDLSGLLGSVSGKVAGVQAGGLLAFLSGAILGQYDPFTVDSDTGGPGVLMLVVPNIIAVERSLKVVPSDFRLWVCLHEVTHRVQFSANPWLRQYMADNVEILTSETSESTSEMVARLTAALRSDKPREKGIFGAMQLLQSPEQYEAFSRMMMLGTLLEGHADHVMDAVGPAQVPTVAAIRAAFDARRTAPRNPVQRILRALIGMDAKMAQYIRGKAFVDEVVSTVGMGPFNAIWTNESTMPLPAEIDEPAKWIKRVL